MSSTYKTNHSFLSLVSVGTLVFFSACFDNGGGTPSGGGGGSESSSSASNTSNNGISLVDGGTGTNTPTSLSGKMSITKVVVGSGSQSGEVTVFFNPEKSAYKLSSACNLNDNAVSVNRPCLCEFSWTEVNENSGLSERVNRNVKTSITTIQDYAAKCNTPSVYSTEIKNGTNILVKVIKDTENPSTLAMDGFSFKKTSGADIADFRTQEGSALINIHRYSCYEKVSKDFTLTNKTQSVTDEDGTPIKMVLASSFCAGKTSANGSSGSVAGCENNTSLKNSAQSNYYDLYIPSTDAGGFNLENDRYACPVVKETLNSSGGIGDQAKPWPMDTTFALSKGKTAQFTIGVEAPSVLSIGQDPSTGPTSCEAAAVTGGIDQVKGDAPGTSSGISSRCLGFAAKPKKAGTCPKFIDSEGRARNTYRLRRYVALYPPEFDAAGEVIPGPRGANFVYVLDRPVRSGNPDQPYTMAGPKPCPAAYFDHSGTLNRGPAQLYHSQGLKGRPAYAGTINEDWNGKNVDGIAFPNQDWPSQNSCAATLPRVTYSNQGDPLYVTLATTHPSNLNNTTGKVHTIDLGGGKQIKLDKVYVRPMKAWAPHYVEDTEFQACAPVSDPFIDAPLHFAKDETGNVSWCTVSYPTQNDAVAALDRKHDFTPGDAIPGYVKPYTSPVVKNSASAECTATPLTLPEGYPNFGSNGFPAAYGSCSSSNDTRGAARHPAGTFVDFDGSGRAVCAPKTCDRTVVHSGSGGSKIIPLVAPPQDIEKAIRRDSSSYGCNITYDGGRGKVGRSPAGGCCAAPSVTLPSGGVGGPFDAAHLEPDQPCLTPDY